MSANLLLKQQIQRFFYDIAILHGLSLIDEIGHKIFWQKRCTIFNAAEQLSMALQPVIMHVSNLLE